MMVQATSLLLSARSEMEDYFEERSERWQCSGRGEELTERMESIDAIIGLMEELE